MDENKPSPEEVAVKNQAVGTAIPSKTAGRLFRVPRLNAIISAVIILLFIFALLTGRSIRFYASFLFLFYSFTSSMWISVVMLGIFQTLLMVPLRIINLIKSANIKEFQKEIEETKRQEEQSFVLKKKMRGGERVAMFYLVNFFIAMITYMSIGRLFLIDFYSRPLNPNLLYDWVPYPDYPLLDRWFKIPYLWFTDTVDLGMRTVLIVWAVLILIQVVIYVAKYFWNRMKPKKKKKNGEETPQEQVLGVINRYSTGYLIVFIVLSYFLIRHFPVGWELRIFSGDVAVPNRILNTITAIGAFLTIMWLSYSKMREKGKLARKQGVDEKVIERTQRKNFKETLRVATVVALGAFFITNLIPSAFELSIFTLEIIAFFAPFTLDKIIMASARRNKLQKGMNPTDEENGNDEGSGDEPPKSLEPGEEKKQLPEPEKQAPLPPPSATPPPLKHPADEPEGEKRSMSGEILIGR